MTLVFNSRRCWWLLSTAPPILLFCFEKKTKLTSSDVKPQLSQWGLHLTVMWCKCPFGPLTDLYLIIAHELQRQECTLLMAQQQILVMIQNNCRAELTLSWYKRPSCDCWVKSGLQWGDLFKSDWSHWMSWTKQCGPNVVIRARRQATMWSGCLIQGEHQHIKISLVCQSLFTTTGFHCD